MSLPIFYRGDEIAFAVTVAGDGVDLSEFSITVRLHVYGSPCDLCFSTPPPDVTAVTTAASTASATVPDGSSVSEPGGSPAAVPDRAAGDTADPALRNVSVADPAASPAPKPTAVADPAASPAPKPTAVADPAASPAPEPVAAAEAAEPGAPHVLVRGTDTWALGIPAALSARLSEGVCIASTVYTHLPSGTVINLSDCVFRLIEPAGRYFTPGPLALGGATENAAAPHLAGTGSYEAAPVATAPVRLAHTIDIGRHVGLDGLSAYRIWLSEGGSGSESDFLNYLRRPADEGAAEARAAAAECSTAADAAAQAAAEARAARDAFASELALKADKSALDEKADRSELELKADKTALDAKADKTALDEKADRSELELKADKTALDAKADKSALDEKADRSELELKADKTALDAKADKTALSAFPGLDAAGRYIDPRRLDPLRGAVTGVSFGSSISAAEWLGDGLPFYTGSFSIEALADLRECHTLYVWLMRVNSTTKIQYVSRTHALDFIYLSTGGTAVALRGIGGRPESGWNHVVVTWNGGDGALCFWVNGSLRDQRTVTDIDPLMDGFYLSPPPHSNPRPVHHCRVFDWALDAAGVAALWNCADPAAGALPTPAPGEQPAGRCIGEYLPSGVAGDIWRDTSGMGRDMWIHDDFSLCYSPARFPDPLYGLGDPGSVPSFPGQRYLDGTGGVWIAADNRAASDWKKVA